MPLSRISAFAIVALVVGINVPAYAGILDDVLGSQRARSQCLREAQEDRGHAHMMNNQLGPSPYGLQSVERARIEQKYQRDTNRCFRL